MNTPQPPEGLTKEQLAQLERNYTLTFTQREWIMIFNIITSLQYKLGDSELLLPIMHKIESVCAVETNIPKEKQAKVRVS
jgi:hypothetical protein